MIVINCEQGSDEWIAYRLGLVSASRFKDVITEPKSKADKESGNLSETAKTYLCELIAEIITGEQASIKGAALDWGTENEPFAAQKYDILYDDVESVGIVISDDGKTGASPDGFVGDDGMIEIKCPYNSAIHVKTVVSGEMPKEHMPQVQGNMMVNGRKWCDFISYDPRIKGKNRMFVKRVFRDDAYIEMLENKVSNFTKKLDQTLLEKFGIVWEGVIKQEAK